MDSLHNKAQALREEAVAIRRDLHQHPELGFQEVRTAGIVAEYLAGLGLSVETGVGKTGVVGVVQGEAEGPCILIRTDMDALPIHEENDVPYASTVPGVMHACGHDGHTAIGLMAARLLSESSNELRGRFVFVFQPAEEGLGGAQAMVDDGLLTRYKPDSAIALHLWNNEDLGKVAVTPGPVLASSDIFRITLSGRGGHGAMPHLADDVITAACQVQVAIQAIVSRALDPMKTAVVSTGSIQAGEAPNVLPPRADLAGTIRTFDRDIRNRVVKRLEEITHGVATAYDIEHRLSIEGGTPTTVNDSEITEKVQEVAAHMFGIENMKTDFRMMPSEDMAVILQKIPGCYMFLGSAAPDRGLDYSHHHPRFNFDEDALPLGAELLTRAAVRCTQA